MSRLMEVSWKVDYFFVVNSVCLVKVSFSWYMYLQSQVVRFEVWEEWWSHQTLDQGFWFEPLLFHHLIFFDKKLLFYIAAPFPPPSPPTHTGLQSCVKWQHFGGQCCDHGIALHPGWVGGWWCNIHSMVLHGASNQEKPSLCRPSCLF